MATRKQDFHHEWEKIRASYEIKSLKYFSLDQAFVTENLIMATRSDICLKLSMDYSSWKVHNVGKAQNMRGFNEKQQTKLHNSFLTICSTFNNYGH